MPFSTRETMVGFVVAHLQSRADAIGMRAALDEANEVLAEARERVGFGHHPQAPSQHRHTPDRRLALRR